MARIDPRRLSAEQLWLILSAVVGLIVAAIVTSQLLQQGVLSGHLRKSLVPFELGAAAGGLCGLGLASVRVPRLRGALLKLAVTLAVAGGTFAWVVQNVPSPLHRSNFKEWIPVLAGAGLVLWVLAFVVERITRRRLWGFTALIAGIALAAVTLQVGKYQYEAFSGSRVRAWNVFHYYVGSKYFGELSYYDLYAASLTADDDFLERKARAKGKERKRLRKVKDFEGIKKSRDQRDYKVKPRAEIVAGFDRSIMSEERLDADEGHSIPS